MQTFTFDELDNRGKHIAYGTYSHAIIDHMIPETVEPTFDLVCSALRDGWRFTERGERIA